MTQVENIRRQVRVYLVVFAVLAALTVITVGMSYLHLSTRAAVSFAMLVAVVKGTLVALYFMHLIGEQRAVYYLLGATGLFLLALMYVPGSWITNDMRTHTLWDTLPQEGRLPHVTAAPTAERQASEDVVHDTAPQ
jgi:cytochrome c oxidase subunit 4